MLEILTLDSPDSLLRQHGIPTAEIFCGKSYTFSRIERLLDYPIYVDNLLNPIDRFHFLLTLRGKRKSVYLQSEVRQYNGPWYRQGDEPSCFPWDIVNALNVQGIRPNSQMLADLVVTANRGSEEDGKIVYGLSYDMVLGIINRYSKSRGFLFNRANVELQPNMNFLNSAVLKSALDHSQTILTIVNSFVFYGYEESPPIEAEGHAICMVGYRVSRDGVMDVQVIDSNYGKIWTSLEHLSACVTPQNTYFVGRL